MIKSSMTFFFSTSLTLLFLVLGHTTSQAQTDFFWVGNGGDGDWNNALNWADFSGGTGGIGVPTATDNANFDENSFFGEPNVTVADGVFEIANVDWSFATNSPTFNIESDGNLSVSGSFTLIENMDFANLGSLLFSTDVVSVFDVTFANQDVGYIRFENPNFNVVMAEYATWNLQDDVNAGLVEIADGAEITTEFGFVNITASAGMTISENTEGDLGFSFIHLGGNWVNQSTSILTTNTTVRMDIAGSGGSFSFDGGGAQYSGLIFGGAHDYLITGTNTFDQLIITDQANVQISYFETQSINQLSAIGTAIQPVGLRSDDPLVNSAFIDLGSTGSASVFYAEIEAIELTGDNAPFPAISSTDLGNNVGWNFIDFIYNEDFEANDGGWTIDGTSPSWGYGIAGGTIPASDGVWATNLNGEFNGSEFSFLESPVIDLSGTTNPTVSLNLFLDMSSDVNIEDFGEELIIRDVAFLEYSFDGTNWVLAASETDASLYNYRANDFFFVDGPISHNGWTFQNSDWETFSQSLPELAGEPTVGFRLNFVTDASVPGGFEGIAMDDFFIYDAGEGSQEFDLESDRAALVALYNATGGVGWGNNDNWLDEQQLLEDWNGVTVSGDRVTQLDLSSNSLAGILPQEIGNLTGLTDLQLSNNDLEGSIPTDIGNLTDLINLDIAGNLLSGELPPEFGNLVSLESLFLEENEFTGIVPEAFIGMESLFTFDIGNNTGLCEPSSTEYLSWIAGFDTYNNAGTCAVSGEPVLESDSLALVALYDATDGDDWTNNANWKIGNVDTWFGVTAEGGRITGIELFESSTNAFDGNNLIGSIPPELGDLTRLTKLDLGINQLNGAIPAELGNLISLTSLALNTNNLSGSIPVELANLSNLTLLGLASNEIDGSIPTELGDLTNLTILNVSDNQLSGEVPEEFSNLTNMISFQIQNNPDLCEPATTPYTDWVTGLSNYDNSGTCLNTCETAEVLAAPGTYIASGAPYYYTYTAGPEGEVILVSSAGSGIDTDLNVYDACGGNLIAANDDIDLGSNVFQSEVDFVLGANQTIFIEWLDTWEASSFAWIFDAQLAPDVFPITNISLGSVSGTQAVVRWDDNLNAFPIDYVIERSINSNSAFIELDRFTITESIEPNRYIYLNEGLDTIDEYFYRVYADDGTNFSDFSDTVSITLTPSDFELNSDMYLQILPETVQGLAWGDYDNDGDEDIFAGQFVFDAERSYFFENNNDETFTEKALALGFDYVPGDNVRGAVWADFNNDGTLDLLVTNADSDNTGSPTSMYINDGTGGFTEVPLNVDAGFWPIALGDFNNDNLIDFATAGIADDESSFMRIFQSDLTAFLAGELNHYETSDINLNGFPWSITTGDIDNDGDIDLFSSAASDVDHQLFINDGTGSFSEEERAGLTDLAQRSRGAQFIDINNDGFEDIYLSTAASNAGINLRSLYTNDGGGNFAETDLGIEGARSNAIEDFDNDGDLDIFAAEGGRIGYFQNSGGVFSDATTQDFSITGIEFLTSASPADYNNDGFMDFALAGDAVNLYTNLQTPNGSNNYLKVKLDSRRVNFSGIGAKIKVTGTGSGTMTRVLKGQTGPESHTSLIKHFGLGSATQADVSVEWPDGRVSNFPAVAANQTFIVEDFTDRELDSLVMVKLYMENNGPEWTSSTDWFVGPLDTWEGITVTTNRITSIQLPDNNLSGDLIDEITDLGNLGLINVSGNELTGVPDFSLFGFIGEADVTNNLLVFDDIQPTLDGGLSGDFFYSPQKPFGDTQSQTLTQGQNAPLAASVDFTGPVTYQWYKDLTLVTDSINATFVIVDATAANAGTYYVEVHNSNVPGLTLQSANLNVGFSINSPAEISALTTLYNATEGPDWDTNTGWTTAPDLDDWFGVTTNAQGQVTLLNLSDNNLVGEVPNAFADLANATSIDLSENLLTDLPDLSGITGLINLDISQNNLLFDAILPNADISGVDYAPQNAFGETASLTANVVDPITLTTGADFNAAGNVYTWKLDATVIPGATSADYAIASLLPEDAGVYTLEVTNPDAPDLTLVSAPITLEVTEFWPINVADSLMLLDVYNTLGGTAWTNADRWVTDSVTYWLGVNLFRGSVSSLQLPENNLVGDFPALRAGSFTSLDTLILSGNAITSMPTDFSNADQLRLINLSDNALTVLPDSTGMDSLRAVVVGRNSLFLSELEPYVDLATFTYLPQDSLSGDTLITFNEAAALSLSFPVTGTDVIYTWQKDSENFANPNGATLSFESLRVQDNGVYTLTASSGIITDLVYPTGNITLQMNTSEADSTYLVAMYEQMGGTGWLNADGWRIAPLSEWNGITLEEGKVVAIDLSANNLTGTLPNISGLGLSQLRTLDLSDNNIESIPQLGSLGNLTEANVSGNLIQFGSLENQLLLENITFSPQKVFFDTLQVVQELGTAFAIGRDISGDNNAYAWTKDGEPITETGATIDFTNVTFASDGVYEVAVTNSAVADLTLATRPIVLLISSLERDIITLQEIYDKMGGASWSVATNWREDPIAQPEVILNGDGTRVIGINLSGVGLTGDLPISILSMSQLTTIDLSGNSVQSVPGLLVLPNITTIDISSNSLQYASIQANLDVSIVDFDDQDPITPDIQVKQPQGTEAVLEALLEGDDLNYQWYFEGEMIDGSTSDRYMIDSLNYEDMGIYYCEITNAAVLAVNPGFSLRTGDYEVIATADISGELKDITDIPVPEGELTIYAIAPIGSPYTPVDTLVITDGRFTFEDIVLDDYIIRAVPEDGQYIPTYHQSGFTFDLADTIFLRQNTTNKDILYQFLPDEIPPSLENIFTARGILEIETDNFPELFPPLAPGRTQARRRVRRAGCGFSRALFVDRSEDDVIFELIAYVTTNDEGEFQFMNLPPGFYRINFDFPGVPTDPNSFIEFEFGENGNIDGELLELAAEVKREGITVEKVERTSIKKSLISDVILYPVPTSDQLFIDFDLRLLDSAPNVRVDILSMNGANLGSYMHIGSKGKNRIQLDLEHLMPGIYLLQISNSEAGILYNGKVVKSK